MKCVLAIAGSDPMGGAGIQADIKTITALGAHAVTVITSLTAQNSKGVRSIHLVPAAFVKKQMEVIVEELVPDAVKIGMLAHESVIAAVAELLHKYRLSPVVLDPVLKASAGGNLLDPEAVDILKNKLFPLVQVVTPNIPEAEILAGIRIRDRDSMMEAARRIGGGGRAVVVKGGHLDTACSDLIYDSERFLWVEGQRISASNTHGTGCVFSSALAVYMAKGKNVFDATKMAHDFTRSAIMYSYSLGKEWGSVNPLGLIMSNTVG